MQVLTVGLDIVIEDSSGISRFKNQVHGDLSKWHPVPGDWDQGDWVQELQGHVQRPWAYAHIECHQGAADEAGPKDWGLQPQGQATWGSPGCNSNN